MSQTVDQTELIRVDDVRIYKSLLDRVFGLGSVGITSTDASDGEIRIEGIADSEKIAEDIRSRMRAMRRKSLFIENLSATQPARRCRLILRRWTDSAQDELSLDAGQNVR